MKKLSIISQNLNGVYSDATIAQYMAIPKCEADIYALQELKRKKCNITVIKMNGEDIGTNDPEREIWEHTFPWIQFRSGYFMESELCYEEKTIVLINFHSSPRYSTQVRYTLLQRLSEVKDKLVILLGDFNAAFEGQTKQPLSGNTKENHDFLTQIKRLGFEELLSDKEKNEAEPHHTFEYNGYPKKLDHIFISEKLHALSQDGWKLGITYIDEVNSGHFFPESDYAFTDHSGLKLTISL